MKNATIEIVAGHSEQNEPVFVCVGREYRIFFCVSTDSYAKKQKKIENWPCQRNIADQGTRMHRFCLRREYSFLRKKTKKLKIGHVNGILLTKEHASMRCGNKIGYLTGSKSRDFGKPCHKTWKIQGTQLPKLKKNLLKKNR